MRSSQHAAPQAAIAGDGAVKDTTIRRVCAHLIDPHHHAVCQVCCGMRLCLDCAGAHLCTKECAARGCLPGLCVKEMRDGVVATEFGVR